MNFHFPLILAKKDNQIKNPLQKWYPLKHSTVLQY